MQGLSIGFSFCALRTSALTACGLEVSDQNRSRFFNGWRGRYTLSSHTTGFAMTASFRISSACGFDWFRMPSQPITNELTRANSTPAMSVPKRLLPSKLPPRSCTKQPTQDSCAVASITAKTCGLALRRSAFGGRSHLPRGCQTERISAKCGAVPRMVQGSRLERCDVGGAIREWQHRSTAPPRVAKLVGADGSGCSGAATQDCSSFAPVNSTEVNPSATRAASGPIALQGQARRWPLRHDLALGCHWSVRCQSNRGDEWRWQRERGGSWQRWAPSCWPTQRLRRSSRLS